jgi:hypothetical protein
MVLVRCGQCHEWLDLKYAVSWTKETPDVPHAWYFCTTVCMGRFTKKWEEQRIVPHGLPSWHGEG